MKWLAISLLLTISSCAMPDMPQRGNVELEVVPPDSIQTFAPFAPLAGTGSTEPCATLRFIRALAKPAGTELTPFATDVMLLDSSGLLHMDELPTGDYDITVEIISATERTVFSGTKRVTVRVDATANAVVPLVEVGGCPRPNPAAPTVASYPDFSSCSPLTFEGTKPVGTVLLDAADASPFYSVTGDTTWSKPIFISDPSLQNGFSLETAWSDDLKLTSIDKLQVTLSFDDSVLCFDPYFTGNGTPDISVNGKSVSLQWEQPTNSTSLVGTVILAYKNGRSGSAMPVISTMTMSGVAPGASNAVLLDVIDNAALNTASVTLPDRIQNWDLHLFSVQSLPGGFFARDAGATWIAAPQPANTLSARSTLP